ncbi:MULTISPECIES: GNAT family N-acetyltransferase [unclassified Microbacterium]|uniref:GNAT family N-acetyltransferase n=1 Tax=unclassified Microbacterium TaxID=2609290 RepID=UPI0012FCB502|nr:GNAT family N-acetyltransferase [Microbacterium sp. MAH-37]MVQ42834.1 GNAT family N-acetyltransferase [Microbacterium sp. MAH-37]
MHSPWPVSVGDLELRTPTPGDIDQVVAFRNLPEANRFMIRTSVDPDQLRSELAALATSTNDYSCVVARDEEVVAIGFLDIVDGIGQPGRPTGTEGVIGYIVRPGHWGQGIASAVVPELLRAGFDGLGLRRITAACTAANTASARALARAGMRRERHGIADEWHAELGWTDSFGFALLAAEWRLDQGRDQR